MRPNFRTAAWVLLTALYGACGSRALPNNNPEGSVAGSTGSGTGGGQGHPGVADAGGAGQGAGGGGTSGAAGAPADMPECPRAAATGQPCAAAATVCNSTICTSCSDQHWRLIRQGPCVCDAAGVWRCTPIAPIGPIGDCFVDPPLDCEFAQLLYEDATCETHPLCSD
jgi:hypothetical protein